MSSNGSGTQERTKKGAPCELCGDVGYDMRVYYSNNDVVHFCHKISANKGDRIIVGGKEYICIAANREYDIVGFFNLFKEYLPKEEWIKQQEQNNPNWRSRDSYRRTDKTSSPKMSPKSRPVIIPPSTETVVEGLVEPLPPKELDRRHRAFLNLLTLESKHKEILLREWKSPIHDVGHLLTDYPICSLPPLDNVRFSNTEHFNNPTRKRIVRTLYEMFGDLRGFPGMYMRSGNYWDNQPEIERWTLTYGEGIIFPCYDKDGYIHGLRYRDDYPAIEVKEGKHNPFEGQYGTFYHSYDQNNHHIWSFYQKGEKNGRVVYSDSVKNIELTSSGIPAIIGKTSGKYKTISSSHIVRKDNRNINTFLNGCTIGSPYSLYTQPGDNFSVVMCTEGEKKAMVCNAIKHFPTISVPGVSGYNALFEPNANGKSVIDSLLEKGMKCFILCYDADKVDNERVAQAEKAFIERLKSVGISPKIGYWKKGFDKGLDDILLAGIDIVLTPA